MKSSSVKRGFNGLVGNKGAVAVSMQIGNTPFRFFNCHLTSGEEREDRREKDFRHILKAIEKKGNEKELLFLMGDFNFRIDGENPVMPQLANKFAANFKNCESSKSIAEIDYFQLY